MHLKLQNLRLLDGRQILAVLSVVLIFCAILTVLGGNKARAATAATMNFQARLMNASGSIAPDGFYNIEFKLYDVSSGGSALWTETYYDSNGVTAGNDNRVRVANGYITVSLGSLTSFPGTINWDQDLWLTMNVGGSTQTATPTWDGEMSPRLKLTAVPYAFRAGQLAKFNSGTGFTSTLGIVQPTGGDQTFQIPDQGAAGTYNLLVAPSGSDGYVKLQGTTPGTQQTGNFNINGTGIAGTALQAPLIQTADGTGASTALVLRTGNATTSGNTGNVTIATGNSAAANSGNISLDVGTASSGTAGTISIGTVNTSSISLGRSAATLTINSADSSGWTNTGTNSNLGITSAGSGADITITSADDLSLMIANNGTHSFELRQSANYYLDVNTTTGSAAMQFGNATTNPTYAFLGSGATTFASTVAIQGANALTLGVTGTNTGAIVFKGATGGSGNLTLSGPASPNASNYTLSIPAITNNANVCTDNSICTGYESALTFNNGLTRTTNTVALGGALNQATTIAAGNANSLTVSSDLSGGARSTHVLTVTQADNATNDSTANLVRLEQLDAATATSAVFIDNNSTASGGYALTVDNANTQTNGAAIRIVGVAGANVRGIDITGVTTGTGVVLAVTSGTGINADTVTSGNAISASGITTGAGLSVTPTTTGRGLLYNTTANGLTTGSAVAVTGAATGITADYTGAYINVNPTRTLAAPTTRTDSGQFLNLTRNNAVNNASGTYNVSGALALLQSNCTQTAGTCTDTGSILHLNQQYTNASGAVLNVQGAGTGNLATLDATNTSANGVSVDLQSTSTSQFVLNLTSNNGSTNVLSARADGNVGLGTTSPDSKLHVIGGVCVEASDSGCAAGTGTAIVQGANALTLGLTGTNTGAILFKGSTGASGAITLIGQDNPGTRTITLPDETGTVCTSAATSPANCTNFAPATGSTVYATRALDNLASVAINAALGFRASQAATINFAGTSGTANTLSITGQTATAGNGGGVTIQGGTASGTNAGGTLSLLGGVPAGGTGTNGGVILDTGNVAGAAVGTIAIGTSNFAHTIGIGNTGATGTQAITIGGNGNSANTIDIDAGTGASAIEIGNTNTAHGIQIGSNATGDNDILLGGANSGSTITLEAGTAAAAIQIGNGTTAHGIQIGSNATGDNDILLGANNSGSTINIDAGTAAGAIQIGNSTTAHGIQIGSNATGDNDILLGANNSGSTINIDAGSAAAAIQIGNSTTAHGIQIGSNATGDNDILLGGTNSGSTLNLEGGTVATAIQIGNGNTVHGIQIGTGGAVQTVVVGSFNTTSTTTIQGGTGNIKLNTNQATAGTVVQTVTNNSTNGFRILNSANGELTGVDTVNSQIRLLANNTGEPAAWTTNGTDLTSTKDNAAGAYANGYVYVLGGNNGATVNTIYYGKPSTSGAITSWTTNSQNLSAAREYITSATYNGYIYILGGSSNGTDVTNTVQYAKLNPDGSTGSWTTLTSTPLPASRKDGTAVAYNGYLYYIGGSSGNTATIVPEEEVYYAKINPDGTLGTWTQNANSLPATRAGVRAVIANGRIYALGGMSNSAVFTSVYYVKPNSDGSLPAFSTEATNVLPAGRAQGGVAVANGYVYYAAGSSGAGSNPTDTVYYAPLNSNGSLGAWAQQAAANDLANTRQTVSYASGPNFMYVLGGWTGSATAATVYYTSFSRVMVGGGLDLLNYSGEDWNEGRTGGQLLAGNTTLVGTLEVQDMAQFVRDVSVSGTLSVAGQVAFRNTANSATAFQVQNAAGSATVLNVDTSNGRVGINTAAPTADLSFGSGANRTINVIAQTTAATAGNNLTISAGTGNTSGIGGTLALQGGTGGNAATGGVVAIQGGNAGGGNTNGANVTITGGTGTGTGVKGLVVIDTPTFTSSSTQNCSSNCNITQANIDGTSTLLINATNPSLTVSLTDPTITTAGRIVYINNIGATNDFTLSVNGGGTGNTIAMKPNTTATMVWNGSDWTAAGASSSTDLQAAYNNTLTSAGNAELVLNAAGSGSADGLTIRNNGTTPIVGALLEVQTSVGSSLLSVNNNATEYANNGGAENSTFTMWTTAPTAGGTITRYTTAGDNIATGTASVFVDSTSTANTGVRNTLTATLTRNLRYRVSFAVRHTSSTSTFTTLDVRYSPTGTSTDLEDCSTGNTINFGQWTRVICTFVYDNATTPNSSNAITITHSDASDRDYYIDNLSVTVSADVSHAADGSVDAALGSNWTAFGASTTVTLESTNIYDTSGSVKVDTPNNTDRGVTNNLSITPSTSTQYLVTFYAKLSAGTFTDIRVRYSRDGGTNFASCVDYNIRTLSTSAWTKITCLFTSDGTTATNPDLIIDQPTAPGSTRTFYVDALSVTLNTNNSNNVQIGGANKGGPVTLFTLDRSNGSPIAANNEAYLGSMYYDTTSGRIQCYEADGWGACGAAPDNIVNLNPEYAGAVLNGTGIGTMTADFCANQTGVLQINYATSTDPCFTSGDVKNYYKWTSPQATQQTYSIYVTYQLPATFNGFSSDDTVQLTGRVTDTTNAAVTYQMYYKTPAGSLTQCWNTITAETTVATSNNTWQSVGVNGNEATGCSLNSAAANGFIIFKINMKAKSNASAFVSTLSFVTTGR